MKNRPKKIDPNYSPPEVFIRYFEELESYTTYLENKNKFNNYTDSFNLESPKWLGDDKVWNILPTLIFISYLTRK